MRTLTSFQRSYVETLLWSEIDEDGNPLNRDYGVEDIDPLGLDKIVKDCDGFLSCEIRILGTETLSDEVAHDFCLTRNGHWAGFWDGDWTHLTIVPSEDADMWARTCPVHLASNDRAGKILTSIAKSYGTQGLMVGDDGKLYVHG